MRTRIADAAKGFAAFAISGVCAFSLFASPAVAWATSGGASAVQQSAQVANDAAKIPNISGVDQLETGVTSWRLLRFDGDCSSELFYTLSRNVNGTTMYLMQGAPYKVTSDGASVDPLIANMVALDMTKCMSEGQTTPSGVFGDVPQAGFDLSVYPTQKDAKFGTNAVFSGSICPVFAKLVGNGTETYRLLGIRTVANDADKSKPLAVGNAYYEFSGSSANSTEGEAGLTPSATPSYSVYSLESSAPTFNNGAFFVNYNLVGNSDEANYIGTISYVDPSDNIVRTESVPGIKGGVEAEVKSAFFADQKYYRTISNLGGTKVFLDPAHANTVVRVVEVKYDSAITPYEVVVNYTDENGKLLWSDNVGILENGYAYTLPHTFSMSSASGVKLYEFKGVDQKIEDVLFPADKQQTNGAGKHVGHTAVFDASAVSLVTDGQLVIDAIYSSEASEGKVDFTLKSIDGVTGDELAVDEVSVTPENTVDSPAVFEPKAQIEIDGKAYVPWAGNSDPMEFTWDSLSNEGTNLLQYVYYVPEDYVADAARTITVQYMNVANGAVISSKTETIEPDNNSYIEITGPESFSQDGEEYVRLAGQSTPIKHSYFTPADTYTIYYRNVNDVLNAQTVVTRTQIIDTVRTTIIQNPATGGPAAPVRTGIAATPTATDDGLIETGVTQGDATAIINDDNNPLAALDGTDTSTERSIDDDATPLASALDQEGSNMGLIIGVVVGILALLIVGFAIMLARKRKSEEAAQNRTEA